MITTLAAVALLSPTQVAQSTVVPNVPAPVAQSYDWKSQKGNGSVAGSFYQTGSLFQGSREDWQSD